MLGAAYSGGSGSAGWDIVQKNCVVKREYEPGFDWRFGGWSEVVTNLICRKPGETRDRTQIGKHRFTKSLRDRRLQPIVPLDPNCQGSSWARVGHHKPQRPLHLQRWAVTLG